MAARPQLNQVAEVADLHAKAQEAAANGAADAAKKMQAYQQALAELPPATRETTLALIDLKTDFREWSEALAPDVMPVFTKGLNVLRDLFPKLGGLVVNAADALSDFMDQLGRDVRSRGFERFISRLEAVSAKVLPSLLRSARNVAIGIGGIFDAFLPHAPGMTRGIEALTERFSRWGQSLGQSEQFRVFINYVRQHLPALTTTFGNLVQIVVNLGAAFAPMTGVSLELVKNLTGILAALPPEMLTALATGFVAVTAAVRVLNPLISTMNVLMRANPIGLVVLALAGLATGLVVAYKKSEIFRQIVSSAWSGIQSAASSAWSTLRPILNRLTSALDRAYQAWQQVWEGSIQPLLTDIIGWWEANFLPAIGRIGDAFARIGGIA